MEAVLGWLIELLTFDFVKINDSDEKSYSEHKSKHKKVYNKIEQCEESDVSSDVSDESLIESDNDDNIECSESSSDENCNNDQVAKTKSSLHSQLTEEQSTNASSSSSFSSSSSTSVTEQVEEQRVEQVKCSTLLHKENENEQSLSTPPTTLPHNPSWQSNENNESATAKLKQNNEWALQYSFDKYNSYAHDDIGQWEFSDNFLCKGIDRYKYEQQEEYEHGHCDLNQVDERQIKNNIDDNNENDVGGIKNNKFANSSVTHTIQNLKQSNENLTNNQNRLFDATDLYTSKNICTWHENEEASNNLINHSANVNICSIRQKLFSYDNTVSKTNDNTNDREQKSRLTANTESFDSNSSASNLSNKTSCSPQSSEMEKRHLSNVSSSEADRKRVWQQKRLKEDCVLHGHNTNMALISWSLTGPENLTQHALSKCTRAEQYHQSYKNKLIATYLEEVEPPTVEVEAIASSTSRSSSEQEEEDYESEVESEDACVAQCKPSREANRNKMSANKSSNKNLQYIENKVEPYTNKQHSYARKAENCTFSKEENNVNIKSDLEYKKKLQEEWLSANNKTDNTVHTFVNHSIAAPIVFETEQTEQRLTCYTNLNKRHATNGKNDCTNNNNIIRSEENLMLPIMTSLNGLKKSFYGEMIGTPIASVHPVRDITILDLETANKKETNNLKQGQDYNLEENKNGTDTEIDKSPVHYEKEKHLHFPFLSSVTSAISSLSSSTRSRALYSSHSVEVKVINDQTSNEEKE